MRKSNKSSTLEILTKLYYRCDDLKSYSPETILLVLKKATYISLPSKVIIGNDTSATQLIF